MQLHEPPYFPQKVSELSFINFIKHCKKWFLIPISHEYGYWTEHTSSSHRPSLSSKSKLVNAQFCPPDRLSGWPGAQFVYTNGLPSWKLYHESSVLVAANQIFSSSGYSCEQTNIFLTPTKFGMSKLLGKWNAKKCIIKKTHGNALVLNLLWNPIVYRSARDVCKLTAFSFAWYKRGNPALGRVEDLETFWVHHGPSNWAF